MKALTHYDFLHGKMFEIIFSLRSIFFVVSYRWGCFENGVKIRVITKLLIPYGIKKTMLPKNSVQHPICVFFFEIVVGRFPFLCVPLLSVKRITWKLVYLKYHRSPIVHWCDVTTAIYNKMRLLVWLKFTILLFIIPTTADKFILISYS